MLSINNANFLRLSARIVPFKLKQSVEREKSENLTTLWLISKCLRYFVVPPLFLCAILSVIFFLTIRTKGKGSLLWVGLVNGETSVQTDCREWKNMTRCDPGQEYSPITYKAGGPRRLVLFQLVFIYFLALLMCLLLKLIFGNRFDKKMIWKSFVPFVVLWVTFVVHWFLEKPMELYTPIYSTSAVLLFVISFYLLNYFCVDTKKLMKHRKEIITGTFSLLNVVFATHTTSVILGTFTERAHSVDPLLVILLSNVIVMLSSRFLLSQLSIQYSFPNIFCMWLISILRIICFSAQRDYIIALETLQKVTFVSGGRSLFQVLRHIVFLRYRKKAIDEITREGMATQAKRQKLLFSIDLITEISTEILSLTISTLRALYCDPTLFTIALPYHRHDLLDELRSFGIQLSFQITAHLCITWYSLNKFKSLDLPFEKVLRDPNISSFILVLCLSVCSLITSKGWIMRWGCFNCELRLQNYHCPTDCT